MTAGATWWACVRDINTVLWTWPAGKSFLINADVMSDVQTAAGVRDTLIYPPLHDCNSTDRHRASNMCADITAHIWACTFPTRFYAGTANNFTVNLFFIPQFKDSLKGKFHPKINICWNCTQPQAIQDVDQFVSSSDLEKFSITLHSEWVPSEWESKQLIKTSQ